MTVISTMPATRARPALMRARFAESSARHASSLSNVCPNLAGNGVEPVPSALATTLSCERMRSIVARTDRESTSLTHASPSRRTTPPSSPTVAVGGSGASGAVRQYRYVGLTRQALDSRDEQVELELDQIDVGDGED